ncbi:MAG: InlB B-repeat-containing protein [Bifidobacterium catenulatum]
MHFRAYNATPEYFEDQRVADGNSATKPTDPVRPGFVFRGWATGNSDDSPLYDFSTPVTEDVWLYALWDSYPYTIRYDANGGTGTMPDQKVASDPSVNTATLKSNEFNYNGRVFTGWNTKRDGTGTDYKENTSYAKLNITAANQIITLYAQWTTAKVKTIDAVTVKCAYSACYPVLPNEVKIHLSDGSTVMENVDWNKDQLDAIIDKGQSGLHLSSVFYIDSTSIVGFPNQRIRAKIVASDTTAPSLQGLDTVAARINDTSFDTMYGINAIDDNDGDVTRNIKVSGNFDISKTGDYQLTYTVKDAAGNEATGNRTIHVTDDNIATITFNPNGGIGSMSPQTVTTDGSYQIFRSTKFTRVHYNLESWNTKADGSGKRYNAYGDWLENSDVPSNGKITLYAQWEHATYTVTFYPNLPNDSGIGIVNSQNIKYDEYEKLAGNTCMDPGYTFTGWNTEKDGSGTSYSDEQQVKNIYDKYGYSITLYAQWRANKYTVQFNANGGTGTMPSQTLTYDKNERLNRSTFKAPAGKMITGWNTKADGTGTGYDYQAPVKNLLTDGSMTLYACYSPIHYSSISVQTPPRKASYSIRETLDTTGMAISAIQDNGDVVQLKSNEYSISQPDMSSNGTKRVTITLKSNTTARTWFDVTVGAAAPAVEKSRTVADSDKATMNYAVSLKEGTATDVLDKAITGAEALQAYKLMSYPEISVFFVQAHTKTFASDFALWAATNDIAVDAVAYTRSELSNKEVRFASVGSSEIATPAKWQSGNSLRKTQTDSSDPKTNIYDAWGITAIGADKAQRTSVAYTPTLTGVIDSGIEDDNSDLQGQVSSAYSVNCTVNGVPQQGTDSSTGRPVWWPTAEYSADLHGTHVAGTIAAAHNGIGEDGVNPNTTLAAIRVLKHNRTYLEHEVCGYMWAAETGMDVTNASIASLSPDYPSKYAVDRAQDTVLQRAVSYATKHNVVNIAAAGNYKLDLDNLYESTSSNRMHERFEKRQPREGIGQTDTHDNGESFDH